MDAFYEDYTRLFKIKVKNVLELLDYFTSDEIGELEVEQLVGLSRKALSRVKELPLDTFRKYGKSSIFLVKLLDKNFLESRYFNNDLKLILDNMDNSEYLLSLASFPISISSDYHLNDMKTIANTIPSDEKLYYMYLLACNDNSLQSEYHESDMYSLSRCNYIWGDNNFVLLNFYDVLSNNKSLSSKYHLQDVEIILNLLNNSTEKLVYPNDLIYRQLCFCAKDKESLNRETHLEEMQLIFEGKNDELQELIKPVSEQEIKKDKSFIKILKRRFTL